MRECRNDVIARLRHLAVPDHSLVGGCCVDVYEQHEHEDVDAGATGADAMTNSLVC